MRGALRRRCLCRCAQGMAQNLTAAREAFERGAALNNSDSIYNLATMHQHGVGMPVNRTVGERAWQPVACAI